MYDVSPRKRYTKQNRLDEQIAATGHSIKDVKAVIMGHLREHCFVEKGRRSCLTIPPPLQTPIILVA